MVAGFAVNGHNQANHLQHLAQDWHSSVVLEDLD